MKKYIGIILALVLAFTLAACGGGQKEDASQNEEQTGVENPWSEARSPEEAAKGAGLDSFMIAEGEISLGEMKVVHCGYTDGIAEASIDFPAVQMTIRKGRADLATKENNVADGDISGDYNEYKYHWTQNIKGLEVQCYGNREGEATKTIWQVDDYCWAILAQGLGGDEDYGLSADDLNTIINGLQ